jgi:lipopolysaccharide biosynthesis glycosyltransferase
MAFLNSFRTFNPTTPLALIPYDGNCNALRDLAQEYKFGVHFEPDLFKQIDDLSEQFHGEIVGHYRKLAIWSGPFDEFLYLDIDTVVLDSIDFAFPLLKYTDVATASAPNRDWVWKSSMDDAGVLTADQILYSANTGTILSSKRFATTEALVTKSIAEGLSVKEHMVLFCKEQPLLNYLFVTSGRRYDSFWKMAMRDNIQDVKLDVWAGTKDLVVTEDHRVRNSWDVGFEHPIFMIHWAGDKVTPYRKLWEYWRYLEII